MLDLETMASADDAAIVAIGAVEFDAQARLGTEFYCCVDLQSCLNAGLQIEASNFYWWLSQDPAVQAELLHNQLPLNQALADFDAYLFSISDHGNRRVQVWGNGSNFDNRILSRAYRALDRAKPHCWHPRDDRDMRTFLDAAKLLGIKPKDLDYERVGMKHQALNDAKNQALLIGKVMQLMRRIGK